MPKPKSKVKKVVPLAFSLAMVMILWSRNAYGLTIDAQDMTKCVNNYCETTIDMAKVGATAPQLTAMKLTNYASALPKPVTIDSKSGITSIAYKWVNNSMVIYGRVIKDTYWTMAVGSYVIDPWWNYTLSSYTPLYTDNLVISYPMDENSGSVLYDHSGNGYNCTGLNGTFGSGYYGTGVVLRSGEFCTIAGNSQIQDIQSQTVCIWINTACTNCVWFDPYDGKTQGSIYGIGTTVTGKIQFANNGVGSFWINSSDTVNSGTWHHICFTYNLTSKDCAFYKDGFLNGTISSCADALTASTATTYFLGKRVGQLYVGTIDEFQIWNRTMNITEINNIMNTAVFNSANITYYYTTNLYLNGTESNITITDGSPLNSTATTNFTNGNSTIYINGTLSANNKTTSTNITSLTNGIWNITGWFGNTSANSTTTYWATIINPTLSIKAPVIVCFKTQPVCVKLSDFTVYKFNQRALLEGEYR